MMDRPPDLSTSTYRLTIDGITSRLRVTPGGDSVKEVSLALPELMFVVATRAALGAGIGLLLAGRLPEHRRQLAGATLFGIGAVATIPAVASVIRGVRRSERHPTSRLDKASHAMVERDVRLIGATRFPRKGDEAF